MDTTLIDGARRSLLAERDRLREELAVEIEGPGQMTYGSQAAAATHVFEQQRDLALREKNQLHLVAVQEALLRLDEGGWGLCRRCGQAIAQARLEALPWAAFCISCQALEDRIGR